jgi:hypothetical protein
MIPAVQSFLRFKGSSVLINPAFSKVSAVDWLQRSILSRTPLLDDFSAMRPQHHDRPAPMIAMPAR